MTDFTNGVLVSKVQILKPNEFDMWKLRIKQYMLLTDYTMWDVVEKGPKSKTIVADDGTEKKRPPPSNDLERKNKVR